MKKYPSGLQIIEAMVPKLSRFAFETKTDYFTELHSKDYLDSIIYKIVKDRMESGPRRFVHLENL